MAGIPTLRYLSPDVYDRRLRREAMVAGALAGFMAGEQTRSKGIPAPPQLPAGPQALAQPPMISPSMAPPSPPMGMTAPPMASAPPMTAMPGFAEGGVMPGPASPPPPMDSPIPLRGKMPEPSELPPFTLPAHEIVNAALMNGRPDTDAMPMEMGAEPTALPTAGVESDAPAVPAPPAFTAWLSQANSRGLPVVAAALVDIYRRNPSTADELYEIAMEIDREDSTALPPDLQKVIRNGMAGSTEGTAGTEPLGQLGGQSLAGTLQP